MTAIVGTLNRSGIAFAADSAATLITPSASKITNNTNKIFELSKCYPVGIAIYNNLYFYGIPWDTIIKTFRDNYLKDKSFDKLSDYAAYFMEYLRHEIIPIIPDDDKNNEFAVIVNGLKTEMLTSAKQTITERGEEVTQSALFEGMSSFLQTVLDTYRDLPATSDFKDYPWGEFKKKAELCADVFLEEWLNDADCPEGFEDLFIEALYHIVNVDSVVYILHTGLVFWGFGESEFYPSYYSYEVSLVLDDRVKIVEIDSYNVSNVDSACVVPFAQTDVVNTVIRGVDPKLWDKISESMLDAFGSFREDIIGQLVSAGADSKAIDTVRALDLTSHVNPFIDKLDDYIQTNYIDKLIDTVAFLSKEDLADMAESLVRITSLKCHVTTDQDSVGGPVDVAVITKGDGFVWLKCKQYFPAELNPNYFERNR